MRLKHPLDHGDQETALEGKRRGFTLTTLPLSEARAAPHTKVSPEPLVLSVEKGSLMETTLWALCRSP